jgi:hypothetical protein
MASRVTTLGYIFTLVSFITIDSFAQPNIEREIISSVINSELQAELKLHPRDTVINKKGQVRRIKGFTFSSIYLGAKTEVERHFQPDTLFAYCKMISPEIERDLFDDFITKNNSPLKLDSLKDLQFGIKPIPGDFMGDGHYPIIRVSRPGIKNDKAFIYFSRRWGPLSGYGGYYLLRKTAKGWIVETSIGAWIS